MFKPLMEVIRPYPWWPPVVLVLSVLGSLAEGIGIGLLMPLFQTITTEGPIAVPYFPQLTQMLQSWPPEMRTAGIALTVMALVLVKGGINFTNAVLFCWMYGRIAHALRGSTLSRVLFAGYPTVEALGTGRILNTVSAETWRATNAAGTVFELIASGATVLVFITLLFAISAPLTLLVLLGALVAAGILRLLAERARRLGEEAHLANRRMVEGCTELLAHQKLIRAFGQERRQIRRFTTQSETVRRRFLALEYTTSLLGPLQEVLHVPIFLGVFLAAPWLGVPSAALVPFLLLLYRLQPHLKVLDHQRLHMSSLEAALKDVKQTLDLPADQVEPERTRQIPELRQGLEFRDISFRYPGSLHDALERVSFTVPQGTVAAIVGPSGGGKSTLINLLLRLYEPSAGAILADGAEIGEYRLADWRAQVATAGQDFDLFSGTIAANIAYGAPGASFQAIEAAAKRVGADEFIRALPDGYYTVVGERGSRLSGGQRQRIGLARAVLCRRPILILDEPTSALDSEAEAVIRDAIEALRDDHIILVVSHRLSTVRSADQILVVRGGRIVDRGTWPELARNGVALEPSDQHY